MEVAASLIVAFVYGGFLSGRSFSFGAALSGVLAGVITFAVLFLLQVMLAPRGLDRIKQKEIDGLTSTLQQQREKDAEYIPEIRIEITEALIQATGPTGAFCFLNLKIHNQTEKAPCIIVDWTLSLRMGDVTKTSTIVRGTTNRELAQYVEFNSFKEIPMLTPYQIGENGLPLVEVTREDMVDIRKLINEAHPLRRGFPQSGWIGFFVGGVPAWPSYVVDSPVDQGVQEHVYKTNTVSEVVLEVIDGHGKQHVGKKMPPFTANRGVEVQIVERRPPPPPVPDTQLL